MFRVFFALVALALTVLWLFVWRVPLGAQQWPIVPNGAAWPVGAWLLPLGVVVVFGGAAALSVYDRFRRAKSRKEQTNSTVTALVCLAIIGLLWPWAMLGPGQVLGSKDKPTLEGRFNIIAALWSDLATEYFGAAYTFDDARAYAHSYAKTQQQPVARAQAHVATHPPGAVLWFYGVRKLADSPVLQSGLTALAQTLTGMTDAELVDTAQKSRAAPAALQIGVPPPPPLPASAIGAALLCAILLGVSLVATIPAVYGLAALGGAENAEKRGLIAAALWVLAPTTNLFAFTLDALVACGAAWTLYFAALGWNRSRQIAPGSAQISAHQADDDAAKIGVVAERETNANADANVETGAVVNAKSNPDLNARAANQTKANAKANSKTRARLDTSRAASFWWLACGAMLALTTFLSLGALAVGAIIVLALGFYRPRGWARALFLSVGSWVLIWAILAWWGGFNPLEIALNAGRAHRFATLQTRGYWPWVWLNLAVWALFIGWPTVALLARGVKLYNENAQSASFSARFVASGFCFGIATLVVLLLLCLSGNVRGEVERLWLFALAPVCALAACHDELRARDWALLLGLQAGQTLLMAATLAPLVRPF